MGIPKRGDQAKSAEAPWAKEEAERNRVKFIHRFSMPVVSLFMSRISVLGLVLLVAVQQIRAWRVDSMVKNLMPTVIRVNDVGRAELVRLDGDYIPEEPEVRNQLHALTRRMFDRNGFTLPEAIQVNGAFLVGEAFETWVKQAKADLKSVAAGKDMKRARILYCHIERVSAAKSKEGTRAIIRFATDGLSENGAVAANTAQGYEVVLDFRVGDWIKTDDKDERDKWLGWNPLGIRVHRYQVHPYMGADVPLQVGDPGNVTPVDLPGKTASYAPGSQPDVQTLAAQEASATATTPLKPNH